MAKEAQGEYRDCVVIGLVRRAARSRESPRNMRRTRRSWCWRKLASPAIALGNRLFRGLHRAPRARRIRCAVQRGGRRQKGRHRPSSGGQDRVPWNADYLQIDGEHDALGASRAIRCLGPRPEHVQSALCAQPHAFRRLQRATFPLRSAAARTRGRARGRMREGVCVTEILREEGVVGFATVTSRARRASFALRSSWTPVASAPCSRAATESGIRP